MTAIVNTTDVYSNNFFAEMLIKLLGAHFGGARHAPPPAPRVVERFARAHGSGVHAVDGSGLTRSNRASPRAGRRACCRRCATTPVGDDFIQDLALAGHEGTVADRMHGTAADGRCRTKTGTLTGVSNLSGYCFNRERQDDDLLDPDGRRRRPQPRPPRAGPDRRGNRRLTDAAGPLLPGVVARSSR